MIYLRMKLLKIVSVNVLVEIECLIAFVKGCLRGDYNFVYINKSWEVHGYHGAQDVEMKSITWVRRNAKREFVELTPNPKFLKVAHLKEIQEFEFNIEQASHSDGPSTSAANIAHGMINHTILV